MEDSLVTVKEASGPPRFAQGTSALNRLAQMQIGEVTAEWHRVRAGEAAVKARIQEQRRLVTAKGAEGLLIRVR